MLLFFCCKSKKKATKSQQPKKSLLENRKSKDNTPLKDGAAPRETTAAKGRQPKQLKTPPQAAKGAATGDGALGTRTAALFTPAKTPAVADPKKATTKPVAAPKPLANPSDKSKKGLGVVAGVAVPSDEDTAPDTARLEVSDSWRQVSKPAYKLPDEMTRRRLDDPDYQTWRGLGNIFDGSARTKGDGSLMKDPRSDSKSRLDSKSNLSSKSSEKKSKSEGDIDKKDNKKEAKEVKSQSKSSSKDKDNKNIESGVRVTMTSETKVNEENQQDNTKSEHDENTKSEN
uniref:Uncharacterized protein n=1 Tax=Meloidogyne hapla TaxID=6305 RepID=A0A1I8BN63_MELHA